jgi:hypothetical protein
MIGVRKQQISRGRKELYYRSVIERIKKLLEQVSSDNTVDDDTHDISVKKVQAVAEGLANIQNSDRRDLRQSLQDAKSWFSYKAGWIWDELKKVLQGESAQKIIGTITESGIKGLTGT